LDRSVARRLLAAGLLVGVLAEVVLDGPAYGVNVLIIVAALLGAGWLLRRTGRAPDPLDAWLPITALVLAAFVAVRGDPFMALVDAMGALAFTHGENIHFAPGHYDPQTPQGQKLLAHELTHVVQQRAGRVRNPFGAGTAVVSDLRLEAEAQRMGDRAVRTPSAAPRPSTVVAQPAVAVKSPAAQLFEQQMKAAKAEVDRLIANVNAWAKKPVQQDGGSTFLKKGQLGALHDHAKNKLKFFVQYNEGTGKKARKPQMKIISHTVEPVSKKNATYHICYNYN